MPTEKRRCQMPARIADPPGRLALVPRKARVDVDHLRAALTSLHHPLVSDRVVLGHVRAHNQDAVRVGEILLECRCPASSERGPQTGDRGAVSYPGLVLDLHYPKRRHQLLDQVVLLVVERCPAEIGDTRGAPGPVPFVVGPARFPLRVVRTRSAIISIACSSGSSSHAVPYGRRYLTFDSRSGLLTYPSEADPFGHRRPRRDRARRVALDLRYLAALLVDELRAPDSAVGADRLRDRVGLVDPWPPVPGVLRARRTIEPVRVTVLPLLRGAMPNAVVSPSGRLLHVSRRSSSPVGPSEDGPTDFDGRGSVLLTDHA